MRTEHYRNLYYMILIKENKMVNLPLREVKCRCRNEELNRVLKHRISEITKTEFQCQSMQCESDTIEIMENDSWIGIHSENLNQNLEHKILLFLSDIFSLRPP